MRIMPVALCVLAGGLSHAIAQPHACEDFNKTAVDQMNRGRLKDAEITLSASALVLPQHKPVTG